MRGTLVTLSLKMGEEKVKNTLLSKLNFLPRLKKEFLPTSKAEPKEIVMTPIYALPTDQFSTFKDSPRPRQLLERKGVANQTHLELAYVGPMTETMRGFKMIGNTLFAISFFAAPSIYLYGDAPVTGSMAVLLLGLIPSVYTHYQTKAYASVIHLHSQIHTRGLLGPDQLISFERMGVLGRSQRIVTRMGDIILAGRRLTPDNIRVLRTVNPHSPSILKFGPPDSFFVEKPTLDKTPLGSAIWQTWVKNTERFNKEKQT